MNPVQLIDQQIYTRLTTTAGTALYGSRVYSPVAPVGVTYPFIVFNPIFLFSDNLSSKRTFKVEYQVDCWAKTMAQAHQGIDYVDTAFLNKPLTFTNYVCMSMRIGDFFKSVETFNNEQLFRAAVSLRFEITEK